jgi:hypothetical protein
MPEQRRDVLAERIHDARAIGMLLREARKRERDTEGREAVAAAPGRIVERRVPVGTISQKRMK